MQSSITKEKCVPCHKGSAAATAQEKKRWLKDIPGWSIKKEAGVPTLTRAFSFPDFKKALSFTDGIGAAAEKQDHHPKIVLEWGQVSVAWNTHAIKGLHRNNFVMAAKTSALYKPTK